MDAKISPKFWSDPDLMDLAPEEQPFIRLTLLWMLTNSDRTSAGIFQRSARRFSFETCLDSTWLDRTLDRLPKMFLVVGEKVLIKKFIEYQIGTGDALRKNNQTKGLMKGLTTENPVHTESILARHPVLKPLWRAYQGLNGTEEALATNGFPTPSDVSTHPPTSEALGKPLPRTREERRGEERYSTGECEGEIPTLDEVIRRGEMRNVPKEICEAFWRAREAVGWMKAGNVPVRNWDVDLQGYATSWRANPRNQRRVEDKERDRDTLKKALEIETDPVRRDALLRQL